VLISLLTGARRLTRNVKEEIHSVLFLTDLYSGSLDIRALSQFEEFVFASVAKMPSTELHISPVNVPMREVSDDDLATNLAIQNELAKHPCEKRIGKIVEQSCGPNQVVRVIGPPLKNVGLLKRDAVGEVLQQVFGVSKCLCVLVYAVDVSFGCKQWIGTQQFLKIASRAACDV
jgi:hypothetical protein